MFPRHQFNRGTTGPIGSYRHTPRDVDESHRRDPASGHWKEERTETIGPLHGDSRGILAKPVNGPITFCRTAFARSLSYTHRPYSGAQVVRICCASILTFPKNSFCMGKSKRASPATKPTPQNGGRSMDLAKRASCWPPEGGVGRGPPGLAPYGGYAAPVGG